MKILFKPTFSNLAFFVLFVAVLSIGIPNESFATLPGKKTVKQNYSLHPLLPDKLLRSRTPTFVRKTILPLGARGGSDDKVL